MAALENFEALLGQHLKAIHDTATASPPGGGPAWDALLEHYGVQGVGAQERAMVAQAMRLGRGATPGEVRMVLQAVVNWAQAELSRLAAEPSAARSPRLPWLNQQLSSLVQVEMQRYE